MNAIYLSPSGEFYDYFDGEKDLKNKNIRFIGDIEESIKQDYIRIFRFYRFLGCFNEIKILKGYEERLYKCIPNIKDYIQETTSIIVTHRLSTVQNVDQIVVMDKGCIVESGNHTDLLREGDYYPRVFKNQMLAREMEVLMQ